MLLSLGLNLLPRPSAPPCGNLNEEADGDSSLPYDKVLRAARGGLLTNDDATAMVEENCLIYDEGCEKEMDNDSEEEDEEKMMA